MKRALLIISSFAIVAGFVVCSKPTPVNITELSAGDTILVPEQSTILHCVVEDTAGVTYSWSAVEGTITGMGDSATWTAPDFLWSTKKDNVMVIATSADSLSDTAIIELTVEVNFQALDATDDTYTLSTDSTDDFSTAQYMLVGYDAGWQGYYHTFVKFQDLVVPAGETFKRARVKLWREYSEGDNCNIGIYKITDSWQGASVKPGSEPSAIYISSYLDTVTEVGYVYFDVTTIVQDWRTGQPNNGIMLRAKEETVTASRRDFGSREADASKRPALEVVSW
jgi:hypothetical protein